MLRSSRIPIYKHLGILRSKESGLHIAIINLGYYIIHVEHIHPVYTPCNILIDPNWIRVSKLQCRNTFKSQMGKTIYFSF